MRIPGAFVCVSALIVSEAALAAEPMPQNG